MVFRFIGPRSNWFGRIFVGFWILAAIVFALYILSVREKPERIEYGVSFSKYFADELGLDYQMVYLAALDDLNIRKFRLAAHWPMIEPERNTYDFSAMDFQIEEAAKHDAKVILAVGRRLPRWPECHVPKWVGNMPWDEEKSEIKQYITAVVDRYKSEDAVVMWQVENEPYLSVFAFEHCGELDEAFLKEEIALVKALDPTRPVLVTDSGNLGTWWKPYRLGDEFGTSLYIYFWNQKVGQFKTRLPAAFYRFKANLMRLFGEKPVHLIELSAEPWLVEPVTYVPVETQLTRMDVEKFREIIAYAEKTNFGDQYLWGVEWWYWMRLYGHNEFWEFARELFAK